MKYLVERFSPDWPKIKTKALTYVITIYGVIYLFSKTNGKKK